MAKSYKYPGVYVEEVSKLPASVQQVETAIPAFIGYTEKRLKNGIGFDVNIPQRISSLIEFEAMFGLAYPETIEVDINSTADGNSPVQINLSIPNESSYLLYYHVKMFYENGGGPCYIISVGLFASPPEPLTVSLPLLKSGLIACEKQDEITLLVIPEVTKLTIDADIKEINDEMLAQCAKLKDRFAIIDVPQSGQTTVIQVADHFRDKLIGPNNLKYGAAYYPQLKTTIVYRRVNNTSATVDNDLIPLNDRTNRKIGVKLNSDKIQPGFNLKQKTSITELNSTKLAGAYDSVSLNKQILNALDAFYIPLYPSGAIAGVMARVDDSRGVWKAPANEVIRSVERPLLDITNNEQDDLNVDATSGKSINVIRNFQGKGTLIWGARTLAGNDNEWRYVPVRRLCIMVEESLKKSTEFTVFEPNDANTWIRVKAMCENFLIKIWRDGALAGAKPEEAFFVNVGLGVTMTSLDILEGRLIMEIGMAVVRPAEFIVLRFSHLVATR
ncbi:phage tail sheath family protein [Pedobacter aquatilis]|uniref:phage tail sheath family protein n=1 Tax=Pedobacter aquatilis TaxID=351343 RepID=UPI00292CB678|nr:phage tail sheath C-terminal domain-containing protein [Pedobacter aquatilis]